MMLQCMHFYQGFSDYHTFFEFLGKAVYRLKYWGSKSIVPLMEKCGMPHSISPLNEFFFNSALPLAMWFHGD